MENYLLWYPMTITTYIQFANIHLFLFVVTTVYYMDMDTQLALEEKNGALTAAAYIPEPSGVVTLNIVFNVVGITMPSLGHAQCT